MQKRMLLMKTRFSPLLIVPLLAILSGGCAITSEPPLEDSFQSGSPSFTADCTPDPPNYYWMTASPFTYDNLARAGYFQLKSGSNGASPGDVIVQPAGTR
jgi:hypothetical protein